MHSAEVAGGQGAEGENVEWRCHSQMTSILVKTTLKAKEAQTEIWHLLLFP